MLIKTPQGFKYKDTGISELRYIACDDWIYHSDRYDNDVFIYKGMRSDGATGALDIPSLGWWVHDKLCNTGKWEDGEELTNFQASMVLKDILKSEGRWIRDFWWFLLTFLFGGGECRRNGMFKLKSVERKRMRSQSYRMEKMIMYRYRVIGVFSVIIIALFAILKYK